MSQIDVSQALYAVEAAIAGRTAAQGIPAPTTVRAPYGPHNWPPNYGLVYAWRQQQLAAFEQDPQLLLDAKAYYAGEDLESGDWEGLAERCIDWVNHWADTYDPRLMSAGKSPWVPFILFERQEAFVYFLMACILGGASGLVEKSRDMGASWVCIGVTVWMWLFWPVVAIGWGSRKQEQVDRIADPSSIFEKMRMLVRRLPLALLPEGLSVRDNMSFMRCVNPVTRATIVGEIGPEIGRGGRTLVYFVDEAAHLERPEKVEGALSDNTRVRIDVSSVAGVGTVFHRKREAGVDWEYGKPLAPGRTNVFVMDYSEHPEKTPEWFAVRRGKAVAEGLAHIFAREVERDYRGAVEGIVIPREYVDAAVDAHKHLGFDDSGGWWGGLDLADEGLDKNALVRGRGVVVKHAEEIEARDPGAVARQAFRSCRETSPLVLQYDSGGGFGGSVKSEFNRISKDEGVDVKWLTLVPWSAAASVLEPGEPIIKGDPRAPTNKNFFHNFKAQAWWRVGRKFYRTWQMRNGEAEYDPDELISLDSSTIPAPVLAKLMRELSQATMGQSNQLKLLIDKAPSGAKSPNLADALIMARCPAPPPARGPRLAPYVPKVFTRDPT